MINFCCHLGLKGETNYTIIVETLFRGLLHNGSNLQLAMNTPKKGRNLAIPKRIDLGLDTTFCT